MGSAYKRLARVLTQWSARGRNGQPRGIRQALEERAHWYQRGAGKTGEPCFSPDNTQNRLALQAVLDTAEAGSAALAQRAGEFARERYTDSRDYFDLIMTADGVLIARLLDGSLEKAAGAQADMAERGRKPATAECPTRTSEGSTCKVCFEYGEIASRFYT